MNPTIFSTSRLFSKRAKKNKIMNSNQLKNRLYLRLDAEKSFSKFIHVFVWPLSTMKNTQLSKPRSWHLPLSGNNKWQEFTFSVFHFTLNHYTDTEPHFVFYLGIQSAHQTVLLFWSQLSGVTLPVRDMVNRIHYLACNNVQILIFFFPGQSNYGEFQNILLIQHRPQQAE